MTAKKTTVAKPPRPTIKYRYGGMLATSIEAKYWGHNKKTVPTKKLKEVKAKALVSKKWPDVAVQVEEFAKLYNVSESDVILVGGYGGYGTTYLNVLVEESDEQFAKRVAAVDKHNKAIDAYRKDVRDQKAWDKKYYVPPVPKIEYNRDSPRNQVLLQTVLNDPEIDAIIRRKYSY
jgi:hypothetical protein